MSQNNAKGGGPPTGIAGGDLSNTYPNPIVSKIQTNPVASTVLGVTQDGYVLTWVNGSTQFQAKPVTGSYTINIFGDVTGTTAVSTVAKVNGTTYGIGGSLTTGNSAYVSGTAATTYSALNLAGGSGWVTGSLPAANQASQTMGGDVTGTTAASSVVKIQGKTLSSSLSSIGATQDGYVLTWVNGSTDWEAKPVAGGGGSGLTAPVIGTIVTKTASYSIATTDYIILCNNSGAINLTLPTPVAGNIYVIKDIAGTANTNNITIVRSGTEQIEGVAASYVFRTNWGRLTLTSNGVNWWIIA